MFLGTYRHQVDQKNRFRVPARLKQSLGNGFIIAKGTNGCLFLLPQAENDLLDKLAELPVFDNDVQKSVRTILSSAYESEEDGQGRVLLAKELLQHANIKKNIVFVGVGKRVEIWAEEIWDAYNNSTNFDQAISSLKDTGV